MATVAPARSASAQSQVSCCEEACIRPCALVWSSDSDPVEVMQGLLVASSHAHGSALDTPCLCYGCGCATRRHLLNGDIPLYIGLDHHQDAAKHGEQDPTHTPVVSIGAAHIAKKRDAAQRREAENAAVTASPEQWIGASHDDEAVTIEVDYNSRWWCRTIPCSSFTVFGFSFVAMVLSIFSVRNATRPTDLITALFGVAQFTFHINTSCLMWCYRRRPLFLPASFSTVISVVKRQVSASSSLKRRIGTADAEVAKMVVSDQWATMSQMERHMKMGWLQLQRLSPQQAEGFQQRTLSCSRWLAVGTLVTATFMVMYLVTLVTGPGAALVPGPLDLPISILFVVCLIAALESPFLAVALLVVNTSLFLSLARGMERTVTTGMRDLVVEREQAAAEAAVLGRSEAEAAATKRMQEWFLAVSDYHAYLSRQAKRVSNILSDVITMVLIFASISLLFVSMEALGGGAEETGQIPDDTLGTVISLLFVLAPMVALLFVLVQSARVTVRFRDVHRSLANAPLTLPQAVRRAIWNDVSKQALSARSGASLQYRSGRKLVQTELDVQETAPGQGAVTTIDDSHVSAGAQSERQPGVLAGSDGMPQLRIAAPKEEGKAVSRVGLETPAPGSARYGRVPTGYEPPPLALMQLRTQVVKAMEARASGWYIFGLRVHMGQVVSVLSFMAALASVVVQQNLL